MAIDIIDEKLLEVLQENARISISELSKRINLSLSAVSERLKKLEAGGIIKRYTAIFDPEEMGKTLEMIMLVSVDNTAGADFLKLVAAEDDIISCSRITGDYDYILDVYSEDQEAFQKLCDRIKSLKCVTRVRSDLVLGDVKKKYGVSPQANK